MNNIKDYITEKFKINSKSVKKYNLSQDLKDKISLELCKYFENSGSYKGKEYDNRLEIVEQNFNNDIYEFFDQYDIWEDLAIWMGIDEGDKINIDNFKNYISDNREELYNEIKDYIDDIIQ